MQTEEIEIKNLCPMIGMISAGKTSLLNVFYDIDYLEASPGIGTKFVTIIRYNPEVGSKPKFYHILLEPKGNDDYKYIKDIKTEVIGRDNIKKEVIKLNEELKKNAKPYTEIFYFLEVGTYNFEDKEYLKNYDLVDVPGVSEYRVNQNTTPKEVYQEFSKETITPRSINEDTIKPGNINEGAITPGNINEESAAPEAFSISDNKTIEEEMITYKPEEEKTYLTQIFKIIKNKINNGIIVFNIENYQLVDNYRIIGKLQKVINKPIENFLLLLNKIDKSQDRIYDINTLGCKIVEYFPNAETFNFTKNTIVACSAIQLNNELKINKSFLHLLYYHFINYLMNNQNKSDNSLTPSGNTETFMDYLKKILSNFSQIIKKKEFYESIKTIINNRKAIKEIKEAIDIIKKNHTDSNFNLVIRKDDFEDDVLNEVENKIEEYEEEDDNEPFNINEQENNIIILYYYSEFLKNKQIPIKSRDTREIIKYFTLENMEKKENCKEEIIKEIKLKMKEEENYNNKIDNISDKLRHFYNLYEKENKNSEKLDNLRKYINSSIGILKTSKNLYIPLLGVSNSGKSTLLNSLIGFSLLPSKRNECTKKGIIIRHWEKDFAIIRKTKFIKEPMYTGNDIYYFSTNENIIAKGIEDIRKILEGSNGKFTNNEEDFFYEINIKIKFIDNLKIDNKLKEKICFIDLPGFGTNNSFENNDTYLHLILSCNIFLFVVFNLKILEDQNHQMLYNLYRKIAKQRNIPAQAFINKCLFIVNFENSQNINEKMIDRAKNEIINVIELNSKNINDVVNVCFLNAKYYEDYNFKFKYYNSLDFLFEYEFNSFIDSIEKFWKGMLNRIKGKTFLKYLTERLKENISQDINGKFKEKEVNIDSKISNEVREIIKKKYLKDNVDEKKDKKDIEKVEKILTFSKNNINNSKLLLDSNIDKFIENFMYFINKANEKEEKEINNNLTKIFKNLDFAFQVGYDEKFGKLRDAPIFDNIKSSAEINLNQFKEKIKNIIDTMNKYYSEYNILSLFSIYLNKIYLNLNKQKNSIEENLKKQSWTDIQKTFENVFSENLNDLKKNLLNTIELLSKNIKENYDNFYKLINTFLIRAIPSSDSLLKNFISNKLGRENNIEQSIDDIINDIISESRDCISWAKSKSALDYLGSKFSDSNYLNKIIDSMIDNSITQIKKLSEDYYKYFKEFKMEIENEILFKKDSVIDFLEKKKFKEENEIQIKNDIEKEKYEKEKKEYMEKKEKWENICKKYRELRDELFLLRLDNSNI